MKTGIVLALALSFCFAFISPAMALDYLEHRQLMRDSPAFVEADNRLDAVWARVKEAVPRDQYAALLREQMKWGSWWDQQQQEWSSGWDAEARATHTSSGGKLSLAESYVLHADRRADEIKRRYLTDKSSPPSKKTNKFAGQWNLVRPNSTYMDGDTSEQTNTAGQRRHTGAITIVGLSEKSFQFEYLGTSDQYFSGIDGTATIITSDTAIFDAPEYTCVAIILFELSKDTLKISTDNDACLRFGKYVHMDGTYTR